MLRRSVKAKSRIRDNFTTRRVLRARSFLIIIEAFSKDLHGFHNSFLPSERLYHGSSSRTALRQACFLYVQWIRIQHKEKCANRLISFFSSLSQSLLWLI